jgi:hypothetical protein
MQAQQKELYKKISTARLLQPLLEEMQIHRPGIHRNTIRLALLMGGTTPTRELINEKAAELLKKFGKPVEYMETLKSEP